MYVNHASHALSKIQYVHASNLWTYVRCFAFGTKANIGGVKMLYNRPAVNRNVLQIYLTSDVQSLYSSQPACEKTYPNQRREKPAKIRKTTCNVAV